MLMVVDCNKNVFSVYLVMEFYKWVERSLIFYVLLKGLNNLVDYFRYAS